jgi:hypothetical protein
VPVAIVALKSGWTGSDFELVTDSEFTWPTDEYDEFLRLRFLLSQFFFTSSAHVYDISLISLFPRPQFTSIS